MSNIRSLLPGIFIFLSSYSFGQMNPKYIATVGGLYSDTISLKAFIAQQGVGGHIKTTSHHWESIPVTSFSFLAIRDSVLIIRYSNKGNKFDKVLLNQFENLQAGDKVLIFDIWAEIFDKSMVFLQPLEFNLK